MVVALGVERLYVDLGGGAVYFCVPFKCQSEHHCFSCAQNK